MAGESTGIMKINHPMTQNVVNVAFRIIFSNRAQVKSKISQKVIYEEGKLDT